MDLFREVRERVPVLDAARHYGFEPDRQGKIRCPFHDDSHPSLQLYKGARGWWCYVCGRGGSVIDFVAGVFSLSPREAALKLNEDFSLGLTGDPPEAWKRAKPGTAGSRRTYKGKSSGKPIRSARTSLFSSIGKRPTCSPKGAGRAS